MQQLKWSDSDVKLWTGLFAVICRNEVISCLRRWRALIGLWELKTWRETWNNEPKVFQNVTLDPKKQPHFDLMFLTFLTTKLHHEPVSHQAVLIMGCSRNRTVLHDKGLIKWKTFWALDQNPSNICWDTVWNGSECVFHTWAGDGWSHRKHKEQGNIQNTSLKPERLH